MNIFGVAGFSLRYLFMFYESKHRPFHVYDGGNIYFVTCSTLNRIKLFNSSKKLLLKDAILTSASRNSVEVLAWVVLDNHYHMQFKVGNAKVLPAFIQGVNGKSSKELNDVDDLRGRKVWYQYWDSCIRGKADYWKRFNYIHQNPIKHGYCNNLDEYEFSSYHACCEKYGKEWVNDCFEKYPIIDFIINGDD